MQKRAVAAERELARIRESVREIQDEARAPMKATDVSPYDHSPS